LSKSNLKLRYGMKTSVQSISAVRYSILPALLKRSWYPGYWRNRTRFQPGDELFAPDDIVRVGRIRRTACEASAAEWCWGNCWAGAEIQETVALCWPASALLRGSICEDKMTQHEACEAVLGRLRGGSLEIVLVVDDGDGGLECWIDPATGSYPVASRSRGRCPGGVNSRTGRLHRVVWAHPITRIAWEEDDWSVWEAA
jgi:hypothetical protein